MPQRRGLAKEGTCARVESAGFVCRAIFRERLLPCSRAMDELEAELQALAATTGDVADEAAIVRVRSLCAQGMVQGSVAQFWAAVVLLRAADLPSVQAAHDLASVAMAGHRPARALAARSYDKLRVLRGQLQKFGTLRAADGAALPCDSSTTDSERAKWDLPKLDVLRRDGGT